MGKRIETVLGSYLEAICIENADQIETELQEISKQSLIFFETGRSGDAKSENADNALLSKVHSSLDLTGLLSGIYFSENIHEARALPLASHESVVLPDGIWLGRNWIKICRGSDSKAGVLQREKQLRECKIIQYELQNKIEGFEQELEHFTVELKNAGIK